VIGAVLAMPAGYVLGIHSPRPAAEQALQASSSNDAGLPNLYSPTVLSDPAVQDQHRKIVEALELACVQQRQHCAEAAAARQSLQRRERR
jgi:hypothetical protein